MSRSRCAFDAPFRNPDVLTALHFASSSPSQQKKLIGIVLAQEYGTDEIGEGVRSRFPHYQGSLMDTCEHVRKDDEEDEKESMKAE